MARRRGKQAAQTVQSVDAGTTTQVKGGYPMSVFEPLSNEDWVAAGAGNQAEKGEYGRILQDFAASNQPYAVIRLMSDELDEEGKRKPLTEGRFAGKKASTISTSLKQARDSKSAPEGVDGIKITSKNGNVFLENTAVSGGSVADESDED